ncbi:universal stress protein [Lentimicrobium sp.]|jgi:nucleotide-binding universal stress UspA family protein|uniref:universal stress protein n=1 Tax=Lentimicrobium sp. TaxID=2034841 RepID=UPI0025DC978F|nr:universal stress protein [Lentimicrobium sp.]MCO5256996.1 universal stress protein [Lentimicrobium sp.]MCO5261293.1 universal stress protein [Lentimicrobium sp.]HOP14279.1 universal stress protein [Lentimicrobium sp.]HPF64599.1 universal stress protein [Lentimicrobium sp.]HPJ62067.1 universal stress protein [Lentimicrobium sp.]
MKEIVVAIDFSKGSLHALDYAIAFANHVKSNVMMVWVDSHTNQDFAFSAEVNEFREEAIRNMEEIMKSKKGQLKHGKLSYKLRKGKVYQEIANQAKYNDASLIIAGTHGVTGYEEFWIGSNAYRIVSYAPCPVITVRYDFNIGPEGIKSIVLPIDSTLDTRQKVPFTVELAKLFNADIHILALYSTSIRAVQRKVDNYARQVQKYMTDAGINHHTESLEADNITNISIEYARKVNADLIAIMTEQETTASNILLGPYAQQMVNHSPVPVLSIQPKEIYSISTR